METPFLAEIKFIPAPVVPEGWALCDGRTLRIADHPALFALLGTTYGGDGHSTIALPNLAGRKPVQIKLHPAKLSSANKSSRPLGLDRTNQPHAGSQGYGSTYFCIALKGVFPGG